MSDKKEVMSETSCYITVFFMIMFSFFLIIADPAIILEKTVRGAIYTIIFIIGTYFSIRTIFLHINIIVSE